MAKMNRYPQGSIWSSPKDGREFYYAEIKYLGRRYKHKGSPNKETVENWLTTKRNHIKNIVDEKNETHQQILREKRETLIESREPVQLKYNYKGTIYSWISHNRGKECLRYAAEVQCRGRRIRKCGSNKESLQLWLDTVITGLNKICKDTQEAILSNYEQYVKEENRLKAEETSKVESYLSTFGLKIISTLEKQDNIRMNNYKGTYTYILQDGSSSMFKIGKTKNLKKRLDAFCNKAYHYRYIHLGDIEKKLHKMLECKHLSGEWFDLNEEMISSIREEFVFIDVEEK